MGAGRWMCKTAFASGVEHKPETPSLGQAGGYDLLVELAAGGMATVFLGRQHQPTAQAPLVAIKRPHRHLAKDNTYLAMLLDEARLASAIDHPNVVKVRELGFDAGEPFIVMDYVEGGSLADLRKALATKDRALDPRVAVRIALDALAGLQAAHVLHDESGRHLAIVHRDVSPHNILIGCDGVARLTDFGIAKAQDRVQVTRTHEVKGKLAYLAPERVDKRRICTIQSDVFSMAVVLWEIIAGRRLFRGEETVDILGEVMNAPIPRLIPLGAKIPKGLDDAIAKGLARDLDDRYRTAAEFSAALEKAAGKGGIAVPTDVGKVVLAVFGATLARHHQELSTSLARLGHQSVPALRAGVRAEPLSTEEMAALAPPAPSERYTFGPETVVEGAAARRAAVRKPSTPWIIGGGALVVALVAALGALRCSSTQAPDTTLAQKSAAPVAPSTTADIQEIAFDLPFFATRARLDDTEKVLEPPSDRVSFYVRGAENARHQLVVVGIDGARALGTVHRQGATLVADEPFKLADLPAVESAPQPPPPPAVPAPLPAPTGTVKRPKFHR
jgi:serine/threonine-protein kinase